jgi:hypothetical protein
VIGMAPRHDEVLKRQPDGSTVAWDTNIVAPDTRRAVDRAVAQSVRELRVALSPGAVTPVVRDAVRRDRRQPR